MRVNVPQNVRTFQTVREHQPFIVQQFDRCAVGHDFPAIQHKHARAQFHRQFQIVRRDELGRRNLPARGMTRAIFKSACRCSN
jgi:hypothetical protein